jgi:hypothetical protein
MPCACIAAAVATATACCILCNAFTVLFVATQSITKLHIFFCWLPAGKLGQGGVLLPGHTRFSQANQAAGGQRLQRLHLLQRIASVCAAHYLPPNVKDGKQEKGTLYRAYTSISKVVGDTPAQSRSIHNTAQSAVQTTLGLKVVL